MTPSAIGHRIVHGGEKFDAPVLITPEITGELIGLAALAPLHMTANLQSVSAAREAWPAALQIACFDTAFHRTMPACARRAALPEAEAGVAARRFGFHGLSYEYVMGALAGEGAAATRERIAIAHLGAGASICAIKNGRSIETTMGFSTLSGLPMNTRSGDVDAGAIFYLLNQRGVAPAALERMLYERSGLAALAEGDMQELLARRVSDPVAAFAVEFFCYQARRHIGALAAALGGLDRLVFTGGVGANAPAIRAEISAGLEFLGVSIDTARNDAGARNISRDDGRVTVQAIATDEESVIAAHAARLAAMAGARVGADGSSTT